MKVTTWIEVKFQAEWANPYRQYFDEEVVGHYLADPESLWLEGWIRATKESAEKAATSQQIRYGDSMNMNLGKVSVQICTEIAPDDAKPGQYEGVEFVFLQLDEGDLACRDPKNSGVRKFIADTRRFFLRPRQGLPA